MGSNNQSWPLFYFFHCFVSFWSPSEFSSNVVQLFPYLNVCAFSFVSIYLYTIILRFQQLIIRQTHVQKLKKWPLKVSYSIFSFSVVYGKWDFANASTSADLLVNITLGYGDGYLIGFNQDLIKRCILLSNFLSKSYKISNCCTRFLQYKHLSYTILARLTFVSQWFRLATNHVTDVNSA